jgi:hypothetical protein
VGRRFEPVWAHIVQIYTWSMKLPSNARFVIWGFARVRHSHRYIHRGFYETLRELGRDVIWVDDQIENQELVKSGDILITVGIQCKYLPIKPNVHYVLHNVPSEISENIKSHVKLQVFTRDAYGVRIDETISLWSEGDRTLYQPWGIPEPSNYWLPPSIKPSNHENWVGSVWNNTLNQGNKEEISKYASLLRQRGIKFKKMGGTRTYSREGLSSLKSFKKVNESTIGAAIVGRWQQESGYVPCRAFKNVAAGAIPISNSNFTNVFGDSYLFAGNLENLIEIARDINPLEFKERSENCKEVLDKYSYKSGLNRIISTLFN